MLPVLDCILSLLGVPETVQTDNGPPFQSEQFEKFAKYLGFVHRKITPYWPRSNAICERFMRTLSKVIDSARLEHIDLDQALNLFLRNYRATPHSTTGLPPATAFLGRPLRVRLPEASLSMPHLPSIKEIHEQMKSNDKKNKENIQRYANAKQNVQHHKLAEGDQVLVKNQQTLTKLPYYSPSQLKVKQVKGTMVTAENDDQQITRNATFFKKVIPKLPNPMTSTPEAGKRDTPALRRGQRQRKPTELFVAIP